MGVSWMGVWWMDWGMRGLGVGVGVGQRGFIGQLEDITWAVLWVRASEETA